MTSPRLLSLALALLTGAAALTAPVATAAPADVRATTSSVRAVGAPEARALAGDTDGDGIDDAVDGCPGVASTNPTGCPTVKRSARLRYLAGKNRLQARVISTATACASRSRIKLWRVTPRGDVRAQVETSSFTGRKRFRVRRGAHYFVTVSSSYATGIAECAAARSATVQVPRRS